MVVVAQLRCRDVLVAHVAHQDGVAGPLDGSRHRDAAVQQTEGLPLARDPQPTLDLAAERRLLRERGADPAFLDELAVAVQGLVAEIATVQRVVQLQRHQLLAGGAWVRTEEVDARLLAVLERFQMSFDESLVEEMLERIVLHCVLLVLGDRTCGDHVPARSVSGDRLRRARRDVARRRLRRSLSWTHPPFRWIDRASRSATPGHVTPRSRRGRGPRAAVARPSPRWIAGCASRHGSRRRRAGPPARAR